MEILQQITKSVFEGYVPSAKMPERNDSVYDSLQQQFAAVYAHLIDQVVGEGNETAFDSNELLKNEVVRFVCLQAFANTIRSLDLVLTATGFGIVSTGSMTPASKNRVDALKEECRLHAIECLHRIIQHMILVEGWGSTYQARQTLQCLFWRIDFLRADTTLEYTADNWQLARGRALIADAFLRKVISTEYMDELLDKLRNHSLDDADNIIVNKCIQLMGTFISDYDTCKSPDQKQLDAIMQHMETYTSNYPTYEQSETYKARHAERYQNRKEDSTFFFM